MQLKQHNLNRFSREKKKNPTKKWDLSTTCEVVREVFVSKRAAICGEHADTDTRVLRV